jgi:heme-degrading monooxygenase HmoA
VSVVLINLFEVPEGREDEFKAAWHAAADYLATKPGYISTRLHRSLTRDARFRFVNVAEWESAEHVKESVFNPEFRSVARSLAEYSSTPDFYSVAYEHHTPADDPALNGAANT